MYIHELVRIQVNHSWELLLSGKECLRFSYLGYSFRLIKFAPVQMHTYIDTYNRIKFMEFVAWLS